MDKAELRQFIEYYCDLQVVHNELNHMYEKFGREFIFDLPVEYKIDSIDGERYTVVQGTNWMHSTTEPACYCHGKPEFCLLGMYVELDEWLPLSALSSEERAIFKLKYG